jgi:hypothetical protein
MKAGVVAEMTARVNPARAVFTNRPLKVLASTCARQLVPNCAITTAVSPHQHGRYHYNSSIHVSKGHLGKPNVTQHGEHRIGEFVQSAWIGRTAGRHATIQTVTIIWLFWIAVLRCTRDPCIAGVAEPGANLNTNMRSVWVCPGAADPRKHLHFLK